MRTLPAVVLAAVVVLPVLSCPASSAAGLASAGLPSIPTFSVPAHPVATKVSELAFAPVIQAASGAAAAGRPATPLLLLSHTGTAAFQTLGVSWAGDTAEPGLRISVRTHRASCETCAPANAPGPSTASPWSAWNDLDQDDGDAGLGGPGARGGTDPLWVGPSDGVEARIVLRSGRLPRDLKLELVNPGSSGYDATPATTTPLAAAGTISAVGVAEPAILSRAAWGADESKVRYAPTYMPTIKAAVLHHTAGPNNYSAAQVPSIIRGDYAYHLSRGWSDIGYNALVDRFGRIWEGRAGGITKAVMGAHAGGFNTDTFGVSMIGNYDVARPSAAAVSAVVRVMAWKLDLNHRDPLGTTRLTSAGGGTARYRAGRTVTFPVIMGHRNTGFTACPGRYLYPYLPSIRSRVRDLMKAALTNVTRPPAVVARGARITITAGSLAAQSWRLDVTAPCAGGRVARIRGAAAAQAKITATWNGRLANGSPAPPGRYTLTLTSASTAGTARPVSLTVLVVPPVPAPAHPGTPSGGPGGYQPVTPTRLLDTRTTSQGGPGPSGRVDLPVLGQAGIPLTGVTAVVLNLTVVCVSEATSLTVWPSGGPQSGRPVTSVPFGSTRSVLVTSGVGAGGAVSIGNAHGVTDLTADVVGYYLVGGSPIQPIRSARIYDSRLDPAGELVADQARAITLPASLGAVPLAQIKAVIVDVSALSPSGEGTLTAYRPGDAGLLASLPFHTGHSVDNLAVVEVADSAIMLKATGANVNAVLDVRGVVLDGAALGNSAGGLAFTPIKPTLLLDTRTAGGALKPGTIRKVLVTGPGTPVPAGASAVLIDLTALAPSAATWLQAYAWGEVAPNGAGVRVAAADSRGNLVLVPVGPGGAIAVQNARGSTQLQLDVLGYFQ